MAVKLGTHTQKDDGSYFSKSSNNCFPHTGEMLDFRSYILLLNNED